MYKLIINLLEEKNLKMKESTSCIDFDELWTMKPKTSAPIRKLAETTDLLKSKHEKLDEEVPLYIQRNHAASDLTLNEKHLDNRLSLLLNLITERDLACESSKFISRPQLSTINPDYHQAASDLMLCQKAIDKRLSLPVNLDKSVNQAPLRSYACVNDLSICEPTKLIKTER